jgi:hypothetical protein
VKQAKAALKQMARMPRPPLDLFVTAATSPSRQISHQAQVSLSELLRKWQHQLKAGRSVGQVSDRLQELAAALERERELFSARDDRWVAKVAEQLILLANMAPPDDRLGLALHCDSLLARTKARTGHTSSEVIPIASTADDVTADSLFGPPSRSAIQSLLSTIDTTSNRATRRDTSRSPRASAFGQADSSIRGSRPDLRESVPAPLPRKFVQPNRETVESASPIPVFVPKPAGVTSADPWATIESRALLERWLAVNGARKLQIEQELQRRGFGYLRPDLVRLAMSGDSKERTRLVRDLLDTPGVGTKAWLMLLSADADAEVRLAAVSVMATSSDAELLESAWQAALHDRDPRIAGLAERLRDRRDNREQR